MSFWREGLTTTSAVEIMRADLPCSVASEELMTGADLPSSIFYGGTQYRNGVTKGLITEAGLPRGRKKGFP
jgi:hypothetical protein